MDFKSDSIELKERKNLSRVPFSAQGQTKILDEKFVSARAVSSSDYAMINGHRDNSDAPVQPMQRLSAPLTAEQMPIHTWSALKITTQAQRIRAQLVSQGKSRGLSHSDWPAEHAYNASLVDYFGRYSVYHLLYSALLVSGIIGLLTEISFEKFTAGLLKDSLGIMGWRGSSTNYMVIPLVWIGDFVSNIFSGNVTGQGVKNVLQALLYGDLTFLSKEYLGLANDEQKEILYRDALINTAELVQQRENIKLPEKEFNNINKLYQAQLAAWQQPLRQVFLRPLSRYFYDCAIDRFALNFVPHLLFMIPYWLFGLTLVHFIAGSVPQLLEGPGLLPRYPTDVVGVASIICTIAFYLAIYIGGGRIAVERLQYTIAHLDEVIDQFGKTFKRKWVDFLGKLGYLAIFAFWALSALVVRAGMFYYLVSSLYSTSELSSFTSFTDEVTAQWWVFSATTAMVLLTASQSTYNILLPSHTEEQAARFKRFSALLDEYGCRTEGWSAMLIYYAKCVFIGLGAAASIPGMFLLFNTVMYHDGDFDSLIAAINTSGSNTRTGLIFSCLAGITALVGHGKYFEPRRFDTPAFAKVEEFKKAYDDWCNSTQLLKMQQTERRQEIRKEIRKERKVGEDKAKEASSALSVPEQKLQAARTAFHTMLTAINFKGSEKVAFIQLAATDPKYKLVTELMNIAGVPSFHTNYFYQLLNVAPVNTHELQPVRQTTYAQDFWERLWSGLNKGAVVFVIGTVVVRWLNLVGTFAEHFKQPEATPWYPIILLAATFGQSLLQFFLFWDNFSKNTKAFKENMEAFYQWIAFNSSDETVVKLPRTLAFITLVFILPILLGQEQTDSIQSAEWVLGVLSMLALLISADTVRDKLSGWRGAAARTRSLSDVNDGAESDVELRVVSDHGFRLNIQEDDTSPSCLEGLRSRITGLFSGRRVRGEDGNPLLHRYPNAIELSESAEISVDEGDDPQGGYLPPEVVLQRPQVPVNVDDEVDADEQEAFVI